MKAPSMQMQIKDTTGADDHAAVLKQIMASDFIQESTADYLRHDGKEAQLLLETQQDREFDNGNLPHTSGTCNELLEEQFPCVQALLSLPPPSLPLAVSDSAAPLPPLLCRSKRIEACIKPRPFSRLLSHYKRIRRQI